MRMNFRLYYFWYSNFLKRYTLPPAEPGMFLPRAQNPLFPEQFLLAIKYRVQHLTGIRKSLIGFFLQCLLQDLFDGVRNTELIHIHFLLKDIRF